MSKDQHTPALGQSRQEDASSAPARPGDGFLSTLADLEARLGALKGLHEQTSRRDSAIEARELELQAREQAIETRIQELEHEKSELQARAVNVGQQARSAQQESERQAQALAQREQEITSRERTAHEKLKEAEAREQQVLESIRSKRSELESLKQRFDESVARAEEQNRLRLQELDAREREVDEHNKSIAALRVRAESELARSQKDQEQVKELEQALSDRERSLEERSSKIASVESELREREFDLQKHADEIEREKASVTEHARTLAAQMTAQSDEAQSAIWSNRLESIQIQLGEASAERARLATELMQAKADIESLTQELIESNRSRGVPAEDHARTQEELAALRTQLEEAQATSAMLQDQFEEVQAQAKSEEQSKEREAASRNAETVQIKQKFDAASREIKDMMLLRDQSQARAMELEGELSKAVKARDEAIENAQDAREVAQREREQARQDASERVEKAEYMRVVKELEAAQRLVEEASVMSADRVSAQEVKERDALIAGLREALTQAERGVGELKAQYTQEHQAVVSELKAQIEAAQSASAGASDAASVEKDQKITDLQTRLANVQRELSYEAGEQISKRDQQISELKARLLSGAPAPEGAAGERMVELEGQNASLREHLSRAEAMLAGAVSPSLLEERDRVISDLQMRLDSASHDKSNGVPPEEIIKRDEAIVLLKERLDQALAERSELAQRLEQLAGDRASVSLTSSGQSNGPSDEDFRRRDRLRKYKSMLQAQARKILAAQTAIQKRHSECENVLTQRQKLATLASQLSRAEKKISSQKARAGAAAAMLYIVATLGVLAVLSWEVSKRVWPGTFVAKAQLDADFGRRTPAPDEFATWQRDHEQLLKDPRLMEVAADRMARRGLAAYASAADLNAKLKDDLYVQSTKPGSLTVELRGEGAEKTALVLDTYIVALKSVSDQQRTERTHEMGLTITQAATSSTEPLADKRLERAASVFGGALLAVGLAGMVIWSRLVREKRKFDHAAAVEAALEEVNWGELEASIRKTSGTKDKKQPAAG